MQEWSWRRVLKHLGIAVLALSVLTTAVVGGLVLSNYDHLGRLTRVLQLINNDYLEEPTTQQLVDGATRGIVEALGDPYSVYMDEKENRQLWEQLEGKFGGVGIVLSLKDPEKLTVLHPIKNTPAARAGIQPGDQVVKIDNVETATVSQDQAVSLMRGEPGTQVTLVLYRPAEKKNVTVNLTREIIEVPSVEGEALPGNSDLAYINISQFSSDTGEELKQVFDSMNIDQYKGIVLDLRYNHGGELNAAVQVASYFMPSGPVVYIVDKQGNVDTKMSTGGYLNKPLVVLVNGETASAAEIVSGAVKDSGTGTIIGEKTYGKGIVQTIFPLDAGTSVKLTTAKYLTPNKLDIHKKGIEPDIKVSLKEGQEATITPASTKFDPQLEKAVEVLMSKIK